MENMQIYNAHRSVPKEALKPIQAGRLKGMSDINPMYRIKSLTEDFGACGIGWYFEVTRQWIEQIDKEAVAFVNIALYIKVDGEWSKPIFGTGGSKILSMERSGAYVSDEAYKMATTDAISVACKNLGYCADVYWANDRTKYSADESQNTQSKQNTQQPTETPKPSDKPPFAKREEPISEEVKAQLEAPVDEDLLPHGEGMTPRRLAKLHKCMEFTNKNSATVLATARAKSFEEITEESYIAVMNLFMRLLTPEQKAEIESIQ